MSDIKSPELYIDYWLTTVNTWQCTRGNEDTCRRIKNIQLHVTKFLSGDPLTNSLHPSISINTKGLPRCLGVLQELISINKKSSLRLLMLLLRVSRIIKGVGKPDYSPITEESSCNPNVAKHIGKQLGSLALELWGPQEVEWKKFHLTTKAGPNGQALISAIKDMDIIPNKLWEDIHILAANDQLRVKVATLKNNINITNYINYYSGELIVNKMVKKEGSYLRKLSLINDPEFKTRIIAIFDYWSQTVLKPYHDNLLELLQTMSPDCTFIQHKHVGNVFSRTHGKSKIYSFDLKSATDRFPLLVQKEVFAALYGQEKADSWVRILVDYPFKTPQGEMLNYKAGQPMGAYSSWSTFTVTHHLLVQLCARISKVTSEGNYFKDYYILGDDIIIFNDLVAEKYKYLIDLLGVELSPTKTHVSKDTYEFAKRWFYKGDEITGISLRQILNKPKYALVADFISELDDRYLNSDYTMISEHCLYNLLSIWHNAGNSRYYAKMGMRYWSLPKKEDKSCTLNEKYHYIMTSLIHNELGCNRPPSDPMIQNIIDVMILHTKSQQLQDMIVQGAQGYNAYIMNKISIFNNEGIINEDCDVQMTVQSLPDVLASFNNVKDVQTEYDELRRIIWDGTNEEIRDVITSSKIDPSFNPLATFQMNPRHLQIVKTSRTIKKLVKWIDGEYLPSRHEALAILNDNGNS